MEVCTDSHALSELMIRLLIPSEKPSLDHVRNKLAEVIKELAFCKRLTRTRAYMFKLTRGISKNEQTWKSSYRVRGSVVPNGLLMK